MVNYCFSAIEGFRVTTLRPAAVDKASSFCTYNGKYHIVFTAETHNFPTGVAPFRLVNLCKH